MLVKRRSDCRTGYSVFARFYSISCQPFRDTPRSFDTIEHLVMRVKLTSNSPYFQIHNRNSSPVLDTSQLKKNAKESGVYGTENYFENTEIDNYRNRRPGYDGGLDEGQQGECKDRIRHPQRLHPGVSTVVICTVGVVL